MRLDAKTQNKCKASEKERFESFFYLNMIIISKLRVTSNIYEICIFTERYWTVIQRFAKYILSLLISEKANDLVVWHSVKCQYWSLKSPLKLNSGWENITEQLSCFLVFITVFKQKSEKTSVKHLRQDWKF